nr:hypothetical protein [Streptomyces alboflavus]
MADGDAVGVAAGGFLVALGEGGGLGVAAGQGLGVASTRARRSSSGLSSGRRASGVSGGVGGGGEQPGEAVGERLGGGAVEEVGAEFQEPADAAAGPFPALR